MALRHIRALDRPSAGGGLVSLPALSVCHSWPALLCTNTQEVCLISTLSRRKDNKDSIPPHTTCLGRVDG